MTKKITMKTNKDNKFLKKVIIFHLVAWVLITAAIGVAGVVAKLVE